MNHLQLAGATLRIVSVYLLAEQKTVRLNALARFIGGLPRRNP